MLETPHVAVGTAIATKIPNPLVAIPLSLVSHFVLDKIPHWNPHTYTETEKFGYPRKTTMALAALDIAAALSLGLFVAFGAGSFNRAMLVIACSFASVLPDVVKYPYFLFKKMRHGLMKGYVDFERSWQEDASFWPGVTTQLVTIIASLWWLYN